MLILDSSPYLNLLLFFSDPVASGQSQSTFQPTSELGRDEDPGDRVDTEEDAEDLEEEDLGDVMAAVVGVSALELELVTATGDTGGAFLMSSRKIVTLLMTLVTTSAKIMRSMRRLPNPR